MAIIESGRLPNNWSAQICELFALNQALKDKEETIYTGSKFAFGVVHTFGKIWMEQGLINSKGQDLVHGELIQQILEILKLSEEIATVHVPGHQKGVNFETRGNSFADETTKQALSPLRPQSFVSFCNSLLFTSPYLYPL
jgi:ribonuclease HI